MKSIIKKSFFALCALVMFPFTLMYLMLSIVVNKDSLLSSFSQLLSLIPGKLGCYLRSGFYRFVMTSCAPNVLIGFATLFSQQDTEIDEGVYIGPQCNIGKCAIGKNTLLGSGVHIMSGKGQHNFSDPDTPLREQGGTFTQVEIGEDSWLGNGALVMANVGKKCVVAAGSVVISDVPDYAIVGGNPAKVLGSRKPKDT